MKKNLIAAMAVIGLVAATSACGGGDAGSGDSVKIGYIAGAAAPIPDVIAEKQGFFEDHGLDVKLVNTSNGPGLVTLLLSGGVDVTWAPTSVVLAASKQAEIVGGNVRSYAFELIQRKGFNDEAAGEEFPANLEGVEGARVGVSATGSYAQVLAGEMLKSAGIDPSKVTFVGVGVEGTSLGALKSDQIDLLMAGAITAAKAIDDDIATSLVSTLDIPELATLPESVYTAKRGADTETTDKVAAYLGAIDDAMEWAHDPANADALGALLAEHFALEGGVADVVSEEWSPEGGNLIGEYRLDIEEAGYDSLVEMLVGSGLLKAPVAYDDAVSIIDPK